MAGSSSADDDAPKVKPFQGSGSLSWIKSPRRAFTSIQAVHFDLPAQAL
jgi:hypothetical protein